MSGSTSSVKKFKQQFDSGKYTPFAPTVDPHVVSGLLKLWLRELPESLIPASVSPQFKEIVESRK